MSSGKTISIELSDDMIMKVWEDFERENPGKTPLDMSSEQFTDRLLEEMKKSTKVLLS